VLEPVGQVVVRWWSGGDQVVVRWCSEFSHGVDGGGYEGNANFISSNNCLTFQTLLSTLKLLKTTPKIFSLKFKEMYLR